MRYIKLIYYYYLLLYTLCKLVYWYDIRFAVNKGDRSIRCFNWKTRFELVLQKTVFSALASKLNTGLINKG